MVNKDFKDMNFFINVLLSAFVFITWVALYSPRPYELSLHERRIEFDCVPSKQVKQCQKHPLYMDKEKYHLLPETVLIVFKHNPKKSYYVQCTCVLSIHDYINRELTKISGDKGPFMLQPNQVIEQETLETMLAKLNAF